MDWIDVSLICMGYLLSADGRWRHIPGLDVIARDALKLGIRMRWGDPPGGKAAGSYWREGEIVLSPELFEHEGCVLRDCVSHELGHVALRCSCGRVRRWQEWRYRAVLEDPWPG